MTPPLDFRATLPVTDDTSSGAVCDAAAGAEATYRLRVRFADGRTRWYGPVSLAATETTRPPPLRVQPNPARGMVRLAIAAAAFGERLTVDVLDTGGRRVARLYRGPATGLLELEWDGSGGGRVAPGLYFVECRGPRGSVRQRVVMLGR